MTTLHLVSHTHWDREWHLTFQQFRLQLVDLVDGVLDLLETDPDFRFFNLDAQTIVLEDYLQIRPQARERLARHIREGRITVGPWYQLNDEFLTSGEATVRSLLVGHRIAVQFGGTLKIGYLPDQFGNLSQMPQIFRGFGIDNAIVGRGYQLVGDRKMEFWWEAPDGSRVLASLMALWYNNAQYLPSETGPAVEFLSRLQERMSQRSAVSHLLLMNGVDHLAAQPDAGRVAKAADAALAEAGGEIHVEHSTLDRYVDALRAEVAEQNPDLEVMRGELREDRGGSCLAGVLSTRMYLKQANHRCQNALEKYAEPLSAFARVAGTPYPYDQLLYAWKLLMQNHPHDSICGCSIDQVHREMLPRFDQVEQVAEELTERALDTLTGRDRTRGATADATRLVVFNTLNWSRTDPVITTLEFPLGELRRGNPPRDDSRAWKGFRLLDSEGNEVPFAVTKIENVVRGVLNPRELPMDQWVQRITIEFVAKDVPACGYATYKLAPQASMPRYPAFARSFPGQFSNGAEPTLFVADGGDVGDEYLYRPPLRDAVYQLDYADLTRREETSAVRATWTRHDEIWRLPASATADGQGRSEEQAPCRLRTFVTAWAGVPRVEVRVQFDNRAQDHRLRLHFNGYQEDPITHTVAEGQFDVVQRSIPHPLEAEGALPFHPQQTWVSVSVHSWDGSSSTENKFVTTTVINRGLPEYEVKQSVDSDGSMGDHQIEVTLLRCVGQLSGRGDGPGILTPEAQCQGEHTFDLAYTVTEGDWKQGRVWQQAHQFNVPLRAVQAPADESRPARHSYATVEPPELVVTAVKRAEDRDTVILRFFNITDEPVAEGRASLAGATRTRLVNLNEEPQGEWSEGDTLTLPVGAKQIVTVEFELPNR